MCRISFYRDLLIQCIATIFPIRTSRARGAAAMKSMLGVKYHDHLFYAASSIVPSNESVTLPLRALTALFYSFVSYLARNPNANSLNEPLDDADLSSIISHSGHRQQ